MNSNPNQNPQQPNENVPYPPSSYSYDPYHNSNIPSTDPYQYPPNAPNLVPPPPPGVYPPYASDDPTAPSRFRTYYGMYPTTDRKSTRLNSSHLVISYAVFCLKKKKNTNALTHIRPFRQ